MCLVFLSYMYICNKKKSTSSHFLILICYILRIHNLLLFWKKKSQNISVKSKLDQMDSKYKPLSLMFVEYKSGKFILNSLLNNYISILII